MATPTRVLAIGNCYPPHHLGGYEIIWQGVMRELRDAGHRTRILTTGYRRPEVTVDGAEDPDVHRELDWYWRDHRWLALGLGERLALERRNAALLDRQLREFEPDVVSWWPVGGLSLGLIERVRRAGLPAVLFVLDSWLHYGPRHDLWIAGWRRLGPLAGLAERATGLPTRVDYARAGRWIFCSRQMREDTFAAGLRTSDCAILHPGVASAFLAAAREQPQAWRWRLLYIGRVVEQKGVATAIESLSRLPAEARLRIVGEGDPAYRASLERLAARLGVADRVRFDGPLPRGELADVYRAADAILFPVAWAEPWGLVPLEAMALGRPVIATGRGGSGEYLTDGDNALLFAAGDPAALAAAVEALAGDEDLRERLISGGYATAARHGEAEFNRAAAAEILTAAGTFAAAGPRAG